MSKLHCNGQMTFKWLDHIKQTFNDTGYTYVFDNEFQMSPNFYKTEIKQRLQDLFLQKNGSQIWSRLQKVKTI